MKKVPVSMEDKQKSIYPYYLRDMAEPPAEKLARISEEPGDAADALCIEDRNRLFEPGELPGEFGWWQMPDGTALIANETYFPDVTGDMFDWWFAWHPIDRLRYAIWDPRDHYDVRLLDPQRALGKGLSIRERHWNSVHYIWEDIGLGGVDLLRIEFLRPAEMGYDESGMDTPFCNALVCGNTTVYGNADMPDMPVVMTHFLRPAAGGSQLRSRFWFGWQIRDGKPIKCIPDGVTIPPAGPIALLKHNVAEFTNLASILPEVFAEEKENWK